VPVSLRLPKFGYFYYFGQESFDLLDNTWKQS